MRSMIPARAVVGLLLAAAVPLAAPGRVAEPTPFVVQFGEELGDKTGRELSVVSLSFFPEVRVRQGDVLHFTLLLDLPNRVEKTLVLLAGPGCRPHVVRLSQARLVELAGGTATRLDSEPT
jgi:hypothetical protein